MGKAGVSPLILRELQAEVLAPVFKVLTERLGRDQALAVRRQAMAMGGEALGIQDMRIKGNELTYRVGHCAYL